jgi:hypothetical protein
MIALERLGRHDTRSHMNRLDQLKAVAGALTITYQSLPARSGLARTNETVPLGNAFIKLRHILVMCAKASIDGMMAASMLTDLWMGVSLV